MLELLLFFVISMCIPSADAQVTPSDILVQREAEKIQRAEACRRFIEQRLREYYYGNPLRISLVYDDKSPLYIGSVNSDCEDFRPSADDWEYGMFLVAQDGWTCKLVDNNAIEVTAK